MYICLAPYGLKWGKANVCVNICPHLHSSLTVGI